MREKWSLWSLQVRVLCLCVLYTPLPKASIIKWAWYKVVDFQDKPVTNGSQSKFFTNSWEA